MRTGIFLVYLLTAAIQDLSRKQVKIWVFVLFGILALTLDGYMWVILGEKFSWETHLWGIVLGAGLLLGGKMCGGNIGAGDGWFFVVSGLLLGIWENLIMFCIGVLLCGIYGLTIFTWRWVRTGKSAGKVTIPLLPFVAIPGIVMAVGGRR